MKSQYPREEEIRARAYALYQQRGGGHGYHMDDWLQAEYELAQMPVHQLAKLAKTARPAGRRQKALVTLVASAFLLGAHVLQGMK